MTELERIGRAIDPDTWADIDEYGDTPDAWNKESDGHIITLVNHSAKGAQAALDAIASWKPIDTLTDLEKADCAEIIVGWDWATVWITRAAFWDDGEEWKDQDCDNQEQARGWWTYNHSVTQEKIKPTHWLMIRPGAPGE